MIYFVNKSTREVTITINNERLANIMPEERISYDISQCQDIQIQLCHKNGSYKKAGAAHMNIRSCYEVDNNGDNVEFVITREKMRFETDAYYDCFFLSVGNDIMKAKEYQVEELELLRKSFVHKGLVEALVDALEGMLTDFLLSPFVTIIAAVLIIVLLGWKWLLCVVVIIYCLHLIADVFAGLTWKILGGILGKNFVSETMEERIDRWSKSDNIASFFSDPNRTPYMGKVER